MKFTIVIPTLNRAEYLKIPIESILSQKGDYQFKIIVSDNCSDDNTEHIVHNYIKINNNIRYIKPTRRLSMSKHWEFASGFLSDDDGYVMYLGDDDILSENAFAIAFDIFQKYKVDAIRRTTGYYHMPECESSEAGYLSLPTIDGSIEIRNSLNVLKSVADFKTHYGELPILYHGFVSVKHIIELRNKKMLFNKAAPDIYSDISIASLNITYASVNYPITLAVASPKSNGLNFFKNNDISKNFTKSSYNDFNHNYKMDIIALHVLDCLEDVLLSSRHEGIKINYQQCYSNIMIETSLKNILKCKEDIVKISKKSILNIYLNYLFQMLHIRRIARLLPQRMNLFLKEKYFGIMKEEGKFHFNGDLKKKGIFNAKDCLLFIEKNVSYTGIISNKEKGINNNEKNLEVF